MGKQWQKPGDQRWMHSINSRLVGEVTPVTAATHTILGTHYTVTYANACTVTLPPAIDRLGPVRLTNNSTGIITVECDGAETIKGDTSMLISFQYSTAVLYPIRGGWIII